MEYLECSHYIHGQVRHIDSVVLSIQLSPAVKKPFMAGYTKDNEFKSTIQRSHDKYAMKNKLVYVKTNHAIIRLSVRADNRLITNILRKHPDGDTAEHPVVRRTQVKVAQ